MSRREARRGVAVEDGQGVKLSNRTSSRRLTLYQFGNRNSSTTRPISKAMRQVPRSQAVLRGQGWAPRKRRANRAKDVPHLHFVIYTPGSRSGCGSVPSIRMRWR